MSIPLAYNLRNLIVRKTTTVMTALGIALTVAVLLAILALVLYPIVWLLLLPFRIVGIAVGGVLELIWALITLPARVVRKIA